MTARILLVTALLFTTSLLNAQVRKDLLEVQPDNSWKIYVEKEIPVEFLGVTQAFVEFDTTQQFRDKPVRDANGFVLERLERQE